MGLNDNTKNIELALTEKNRIQKQKEAEKKKKELKKENATKLKNDIINILKQHFENALNESKELQIYYLKEFKQDIYKNIIEEFRQY